MSSNQCPGSVSAPPVKSVLIFFNLLIAGYSVKLKKIVNLFIIICETKPLYPFLRKLCKWRSVKFGTCMIDDLNEEGV